jgi:hypothetical protein
MKLSDFYKDHYFLELTRREDANNALTIPFGVLSILVGAVLIVAKEIDFPLDGIEAYQIIVMAITFVFFLITSYFLYKSWTGYEYLYIASPKTIKEYTVNLFGYYLAIGDEQEIAKEKADNETLEFIDSEYAETADVNFSNNNKKVEYLRRANTFLSVSAIFAVLTSVPFIFALIKDPSETYKIEIVNQSKESKIMATNNQQIPTPSVQPNQPVKPEQPKRVVVTEDINLRPEVKMQSTVK